MSKLRKQYSKEEKLEVVKKSLEEGVKIEELAVRFEVSEATIYRWRKAYARNERTCFPGRGNKEMTETERKIAALEKELRETRLERDILKKAVGIFSKSDRKFSNS